VEENMSSSKQTVAVYLIIGLILGFGVGFFTPTLLAAPEVNLIPTIQSRGYLIVGTEAGFPPFEMYNTSSGQYYGFDIDLALMIADYLNVTLQVQDMAFDLLVGACEAGTVDLLAAAMFLTADRAKQLAFSDSYITTSEVVAVNGSNPLEISSLEDLEGLHVGVQTGTVEDEELTDLINGGVAIIKHAYASAALCFADLHAGLLDAVYFDKPVVQVYSGIYTLRSIFEVPAPPTVMYCRWQNTDLLNAINTVIDDAISDGTMASLIEQWFG
jgi:ABC-type amino acid transport substrate-binding protein